MYLKSTMFPKAAAISAVPARIKIKNMTKKPRANMRYASFVVFFFSII